MPVPRPGAALGASYRLIEHVGSGATGEVWRAEKIADGTSYAAKILKAAQANDPALVERFIRERSVLVNLRHPNIVTVRDLIVEGTTLAIVMDFVEGGSLRDQLVSEGPLRAGEALRLCAQVFEALAAAHGKGVLHRDIKPDNILLTEKWRVGHNDTVRVTDFGIAAVVDEQQRQTSGLLGTPQYMAPELISLGQSSPSADVYSAGVLLYELLAGRTPFSGPGTDFTIAYRHVTTHPPPLDLPEPLWAAVNDLLAKEPRERPSPAAAASKLKILATRFSDLRALSLDPETLDYDDAPRRVTVVRDELRREPEVLPEVRSNLGVDTPELGAADHGTRVIPLANRRPAGESQTRDYKTPLPKRLIRFTRNPVVMVCIGLALLITLGAGSIWLFGGKRADTTASGALQASLQDLTLPSGLSVTRTWTYDREAGLVTLEISYAAQKAPLAGAVLEVIPGPVPEGTCPPVVWVGATVTKHRASSTGITVECGWKIEGVRIPANGKISIGASFPASIAEVKDLNQRLGAAAAATTTALNDSDGMSSAYPLQRLRGIKIVTPARMVSQTPLAITLVPVWPSGVDPMNPLYESPSSGTPSQLLDDIAGGEPGVRFSDGCSGAVAISADGLTVTALSVTSECRIYATVGNFTDLQSSPFSITTRD